MSLRKMMMALATKGSGVVPLATNFVILFSDAVAANNVGIIFNDVAQGVGAVNTIVKRHKTTYTVMGNDEAPVDHTGEWTSDGGVDGSLFEIACTSLSMGTWSTEPAAVGVYTAMNTADIIWNVNRQGGKGRVVGTTQVIGTFQIREIANNSNNTIFTVDVTNTQT